MRILFDQGVPLPLRRSLGEHEIATAYRMGWSELKNGDLLSAAEAKFDLIITTDKNWKHQQRVVGRRLAVLVLPSGNWPELKLRVDEVVSAVNTAKPGDYIEL
jgi:predicted nuclease of predicted toxin-antitoxin system